MQHRPDTSATSDFFNIPSSITEEVVEPKSFRNKLISALAYTATIPLLCLGFIQQQQIQQAVKSSDELQLWLAESIATTIRQQLEHNAELLKLAALALPADSHKAYSQHLAFLANNPAISALIFVQRGLIAHIEVPRQELGKVERALDTVLTTRGSAESKHGGTITLGGQTTYYTLSVPLDKSVSDTYLLALCNMENFRKSVELSVRGKTGFDVSVINLANESVLIGNDSDTDTQSGRLTPESRAMLAKHPNGFINSPATATKDSQIQALAPIKVHNWAVLVSQPHAVRDAFLRDSLATSGIILLFAVVATLIMGICVAAPLTRALNSLSEAVESFGKSGKIRTFLPDVEKNGSTEMIELGKTFETMAKSVTSSKRQLEELNLHLEKLVADRTSTLLQRNSELRALQMLLQPIESDNGSIQEHIAASLEQFRALLGLPALSFVDDDKIDPSEQPWQSPFYTPVQLSGKLYGWLKTPSTVVITSDKHDSLRRLADSLCIVLANKQLVEELETEHARLNTIFETMTDGIVIIGRSGHVVYANSLAKTIFNEGHDLTALTASDLVGLFKERGEETLKSLLHMRSKAVRLTRKLKNRNDQVLEVLSFPVSNLPGMPGERACWLVRDITRSAEIEAIKDNLISVVAHELKTPVTAIRLQAEELSRHIQSENIDSDIATTIEELLTDSLWLGNLIDDLLDLSLIRTGTIKLRPRIVQLASLIDYAARLTMARYPFRIKRVIAPEAEALLADPGRLTKVFVNLFNNAARYKKASQEYAICSVCAKADENFITIEVTDYGTGIDSATIEHIFEPFFQADMSARRSNSGTGLGLSITEGIVQAHGGRISVESQLGEQTTFKVVLPL